MPTVRTRAYLESVIYPNGTNSITGQNVQDFVASVPFWLGIWSSATTYAIDDMVVDSAGNLWISLTNPNLNNSPTVGANWALMASAPASTVSARAFAYMVAG